MIWSYYIGGIEVARVVHDLASSKREYSIELVTMRGKNNTIPLATSSQLRIAQRNAEHLIVELLWEYLDRLTK